MPELPDVSVYVEALEKRLLGQPLLKIRLTSPFVLRTFDPPPAELEGKHVKSIRRLGKRIVLELDGELFLIIHLMIAGRFRWLAPGAKVPGKLGLAALDFPNGTLVLTEAGSKKRASMHIVRGTEGVRAHDPGGMAVHGRYGKPCPDCGTPVQRIVYADNETNYCARCQTEGRLLADRALSRLLHSDWPRSINDL